MQCYNYRKEDEITSNEYKTYKEAENQDIKLRRFVHHNALYPHTRG